MNSTIHAGKVLTHRHLMAKCWDGLSEPDIQVLRVHMRNLRQKIEEAPEEPEPYRHRTRRRLPVSP